MAGSNEKLRVLRRIPEIRFDEELRGYNKHQVDRVLENLAPLADEVDVLVDRLSEAERRAAAAEARVMESGGPAPAPHVEPEPAAPVPAPAPASAENFDETLSKTLLLAQRTADATVEEARGEAARIVAEAEAEAAATREAVEQEAVSMRAAAADERAASIEQANREVAAMIDAARSTIDTKVAEAEAELAASHTATRDQLVEQISSLQMARDALALDVEHFEGHLSSRREVIRGALAELNAVIEDPERLRTVMPPTPVAEVPAEVSAEPAQIDVASLDTLANAVTSEAEAQGVRSPDLQPAVETNEWADDGNTWADPVVEDGDVEQPVEDIDEALSSGLILDPVPADGSGQVAEPAHGDEANVEEAATVDPALANLQHSVDAPTEAVPVIAAEVPEAEATSDPFLDELRRATSEDEDDEALTKFLNEGEEDTKGGWFGRRK